jgi:flagellar biosynthesis chaperone FliJ
MNRRTEPPVCRVDADTLAATVVCVDSRGSTWLSRDRTLLRRQQNGELQTLSREPETVLALTATGDLVFALSVTGGFTVWRLDDNEPAVRGTLGRRARGMTALSGNRVAIAIAGRSDEVVLICPEHEDGRIAKVAAQGLYAVDGVVACLASYRGAARELLISITDRGHVECWDVVAGAEVTSEMRNPVLPLRGDLPVTALMISSNQLWVGTQGGSILRCRLGGSTDRLDKQHDAAVNSLNLLSDGRSVWSASFDGTIVVWDALSAEAVGTFHTGGTGISSIASRTVLESTLWVVDSQNAAAQWHVREALNWQECPAADEIAGPALSALRQMGNILCGEGTVVMPQEVVEAVPECQHVADALSSMHAASVLVDDVLREFGMTPESLISDFDKICNIALTASRIERRATGHGIPGADLPQLQQFPKRLDEAIRDNAALTTRLEAVELNRASMSQRLRELEGVAEEASALRRKVHELEAERVRATPERSTSEFGALREELDAKNAFVMELLEIVKQNTDTIEDLRSKYKTKKAELTHRTSVSANLASAAVDALRILRLGGPEHDRQAAVALESALRRADK